MDKYEYLVQKLQANNPDRSTNRLNELGAKGWDLKFGMADGSSIVLVFQRPIGLQAMAGKIAIKKKAEEKAKAKEDADKKKAAQDRMAKARAAKKAKADAKNSEGA